MVRVLYGKAKETCVRLLIAAGAHSEVAEDVAQALIVTSLRGIDSHGIALLPRILARVEAGRSQIARPAHALPSNDDKATAVVEADLAPGQHAGLVAARLAVRKARQFGIGYVAVRNSTHFGACTPYILEVIDSGMVSMVGSNSTVSMAAFEAPFVNLGNNPLGFGAPVADGPPLVFDFSCGVMSFGRLRAIRAEGREPPRGAFVKPVVRTGVDPIYEIAGTLTEAALPFGGYKGASIALMIEILAGVLGGGHFGATTETVKDGEFLGPSHFVFAIDPTATLGSIDMLLTRMKHYLVDIAPIDTSVRIPGRRAAEIEIERKRDGIPIEQAVVDELLRLCNEAKVDADF